MSKNTFIIRTNGGPNHGETREVEDHVFGFPPPVNLPGIFHGGVYIRRSFSLAPEIRIGQRILRGADYDWMENSEFPT